MSATRGWAALLFFVAALLGCEDDRQSSEPLRGPASAVATSVASSAPPVGAPPVSASPSASGSALASDEVVPGASPAAGAWEGKFEAKKGVVALPSGASDKERAADDGKVATGPGTVTLRVAPDGDVRGAWKGSLGNAALVGRVEVDGARTVLRATAMPEDLASRDAMTGVLVGELKGDVFMAELHVAGPDANVVREASFELRRK